MQPEASRRKVLAEWLHKANSDLDAAVLLLSSGADFTNIVGFHSQQAAEKYLKAFLTWNQVDFPKTHDLENLLDIVETVDEGLAASLRDIIILTPFGVDLRYPGDRPDATLEEAQEAFDLAQEVRDKILPLLRDEADNG